uniref:FLYWCH-type domain-containing protein n=1 Tax=Meloidogyne javanica TaxID=6303 RepID=A0A915LN03_MELJA
MDLEGYRSNLENNENQVNVSSESDNDDSDSEAQLIYFEVGKTKRGELCLWHAGFCYNRKRGNSFRCANRDCKATAKITNEKQLNHHPSLSSFLEATLKDVDKQLDIARAAVLQQKRKRRRRYVLQEQHIMETLERAQYDDDEDLLNLLTLLGLQIQGYVNGLRDNNRRDSVDD